MEFLLCSVIRQCTDKTVSEPLVVKMLHLKTKDPNSVIKNMYVCTLLRRTQSYSKTKYTKYMLSPFSKTLLSDLQGHHI